MTGAKLKYRHLGRNTPHRLSLLRNLVSCLLEHESITTTYAKAREAQRVAEKCIRLAKKGTETAKRSSMDHFHRPQVIIPKLFGPLAARYAQRPGGFTRLLLTEPKDKYDQAPSAILELVDGPKDTKFAMAAMTIARCRREGKELSPMTVQNIQKVTKFRENGEKELGELVNRFMQMSANVAA